MRLLEFLKVTFEILSQYGCFCDNSPLGNCPPDICHLGQLPPKQFPPRTVAPGQCPGQFPPRTIVLPYYFIPRTIVHPDNYCLEQRQLQITIFSWLLSVSFPWPNYKIYVFCYDDKDNNDNRNETWTLKSLNVITL